MLGGGITGLTAAYLLSRKLPTANITLYEAGSRLGGWLQTKHMDVANGTVVFEQGPRTLRPSLPNGLVTLDLACPSPLLYWECVGLTCRSCRFINSILIARLS